jgi:hypothetical protein
MSRQGHQRSARVGHGRPGQVALWTSLAVRPGRKSVFINGLTTTGIFVWDRIFVIIIIQFISVQFGGNLFRYYLVFVRKL